MKLDAAQDLPRQSVEQQRVAMLVARQQYMGGVPERAGLRAPISAMLDHLVLLALMSVSLETMLGRRAKTRTIVNGCSGYSPEKGGLRSTADDRVEDGMVQGCLWWMARAEHRYP